MIAAFAAVLFQCADGSPPPCRAARAAAAPAMSVAVLSFENLSRDSADLYLTEGLSEELTSQLGQVVRLTVASRAAVRRLRNAADLPVPDIGRALNVTYILSGSVRHAGERLRVTVELLRASNGAQVWSSQYDRGVQDLLAVQEDVATAVVRAVTGRLLPAERTTLATRPTQSPEAYDAYLRGRLLLQQGLPTRMTEAVSVLERATRLDSAFALAWALLSRVNSQMFWFYIDRSADRLARARAAAERAVALAPASPESHIAMGYLYYWGSRDYARALQEFSAALAARPGDAEVHAALANVARRQGSWEQSLASRLRSLEIDPENHQEQTEAGLTLHAMRRFEEAEAHYQLALQPPADLYPFSFGVSLTIERDGAADRARRLLDSLAAHAEDIAERTFHDEGAALPVWRLAGPHQAAILAAHPVATPEARSLHYLVVGEVLLVLQRRDEAMAALDSVRRIVGDMLRNRPDDDGFHAQLALALAGLGRCDEALAEGQRSTSLLPVSADALTGPQRIQSLVEVEVRCGRVDQALDHLAYLLTIPSFIAPGLLRADPVFTPLKGNPRFEQMAGGS